MSPRWQRRSTAGDCLRRSRTTESPVAWPSCRSRSARNILGLCFFLGVFLSFRWGRPPLMGCQATRRTRGAVSLMLLACEAWGTAACCQRRAR